LCGVSRPTCQAHEHSVTAIRLSKRGPVFSDGPGPDDLDDEDDDIELPIIHWTHLLAQEHVQSIAAIFPSLAVVATHAFHSPPPLLC
jgi:hypothetical protein